MISIIPVIDIPIIQTEEELWQSLLSSLDKLLLEDDILICAHTPFSRVLGNLFHIDSMIPSYEALKIAKEINKDPKKIEIILRSSKRVVKIGRNVLITENHAGIICANAGVDESNASIGHALAVPDNPDDLANIIRDKILNGLNRKVAVIISDTVGRALRKGAVNIAIGCAGIPATKSEIGKKDLFGYEMRVSEIAIADEIASAAELIQGQTNEGYPFVIVRGFPIDFSGFSKARELNRPDEERLFK